jgi:hypothetical protein
MTENEIDMLFYPGAKTIYILDSENKSIRPHIAINYLKENADRLTCEPIYPQLSTDEPNGYQIYIDGKEVLTFYYIKQEQPGQVKTTNYRYRADIIFQGKGYSLIIESEFPIIGDAIRPFISMAMKTTKDISVSSGYQIIGVESV